MKLQPYLNFAGNAEEAFTFYKSIFGGEFSALVRFEDFPMEGLAVPPEDEDKIRQVEMPIADQAWGDYYGSLQDKFGVMWMVNYGQPQQKA